MSMHDNMNDDFFLISQFSQVYEEFYVDKKIIIKSILKRIKRLDIIDYLYSLY